MKDKNDNKTIDAFEKKALSGAERQAAYREKNKGKSRINGYISDETEGYLKSLMVKTGKGKMEAIEMAIEEAFKVRFKRSNGA